MGKVDAVARSIRVTAVLSRAALAGLFRSKRERSWGPLGRELRCAFTILGPAFVKLGQFLAVRPDFLAPELLAEFEKLLDSTPPAPLPEILQVLEDELGAPAARLFRRFDPRPIASASVSQVHRAVLPGGEEVAVKVQKPDAARSMRGDLDLLGLLLKLLGALPPLRGHVDLRSFWREVVDASEAELDFRREAETGEAFRRNFRSWSGIRIPRIYWGLTARRVLTAEFIEGTKISDPDLRGAPSYAALAERGARAFLKQVLVDGLFHADLHPANLLITPAGEIAYLDFGIVGRLSATERRALVGTVAGLLGRDPPLALRYLGELGIEVPVEHVASFARDLEEVFSLALAPSLGEVSAGELGKRLLAAVCRHGVVLPRKYALLLKSVLTIEGTARGLHPDFRFEGAVREHLREEGRGSLTLTGLLEACWRGAALIGLAALCPTAVEPRSTE